MSNPNLHQKRRLARLAQIERFNFARSETKQREADRAYRRACAAQVKRLEMEDNLR